MTNLPRTNRPHNLHSKEDCSHGRQHLEPLVKTIYRKLELLWQHIFMGFYNSYTLRKNVIMMQSFRIQWVLTVVQLQTSDLKCDFCVMICKGVKRGSLLITCQSKLWTDERQLHIQLLAFLSAGDDKTHIDIWSTSLNVSFTNKEYKPL